MTTHRDLTTPELRPCPFCGGEAHLERTGHVCCMTDGCRGFGAFDNYGTQAEQNASAVARWNRRPRTFTAAEVAKAFAGLEAKWRRIAAPSASSRASQDFLAGRQEAIEHCADELHERITHWLRENEG